MQLDHRDALAGCLTPQPNFRGDPRTEQAPQPPIPRSQQLRGKHFKFERHVVELGGMKQMYMLACTPSSQRYIKTVRAAMARADRQVEELLASQRAAGP